MSVKHNFQIVKANIEDMKDILKLQYEAYQSEAILHNDFSVQPLTQTLEQAIEEYNNCTILKAISNNQIIGSVRAYVEQNTIHIGKLMVLPAYQNQGIGKSLLQAIENEFPKKRYELFTGKLSTKNLELYKKLGYRYFKEQQEKSGLVFVYMEKENIMDDKVYKVLEKLGIQYEKIEHPALYTAEDNKKYNLTFNGIVCKNLFIRNKDKSKYYLVSLPLEKRINLKELETKLNESRLSFGNEEILYEKLKIKTGSVSLLNIIEVEKTDVVFIIDKSLLKANKVGFHHNINTATVLFEPEGINKIMHSYNAEYEFVEL